MTADINPTELAANLAETAARHAAADLTTHRLRMAEAVDAEVKAARSIAKGKLGTCRTVKTAEAAELAAMVKQADIVVEMKTVGFAHDVALATLAAGRAIRHAKLADVNGAKASDVAPLPKAHVKFDGPKDRRRQRRQDETLGNKYAIPTAFWTAENEGGLQEASLKDDAADTGEWFG
jgi:hypothetical protein